MANRSEEIEQSKFVRWTHKVAVRAAIPQLKWLHHSPNGGQRSAFTGAQMKALGTKPGFPDLILPVRHQAHTGLVIEFKSATGKTSTEQDEWITHFRAQSYQVHIARSAPEARTQVANYFGLDPDSLPALE